MARDLDMTLQIGEIVSESIISFQETHALGEPARLRIEARLVQYKAPDEIVGQPGALTYRFRGEDPQHAFAGVIDSVAVIGTSDVGGEQRAFHYAFDLVSNLALLSRNFGCDTFQELSAPDVLKKFFTALGLPSKLFVWRLTKTYKTRAWCVRYQESALAFVTRLCEEEGFFFFSDVGDDGEEQVVFADDSTSGAPIEGDPILRVRARAGAQQRTDAIYTLSEQRRVVSGAFVLRDYNFEKPALDLTAQATAAEHTDLQVYDYPGGYLDVEEGKRLAQVRLDAEQVERERLFIEADTVRLSIARSMQVGDSGGPADGAYVIVALDAEYSERAPDDESDATDAFRMRATLIPAKSVFRLPRRTPKPIIDGPQTATVVAPSGSQPEEIHTDQHGRIKVRFHWDVGPDIDDKASAWFRTEQLQTSGSMILPRISWEVIVDFLEGDPDRPMIVGRVYNGMFMPPYALPEGKTRTALRTVSSPGGPGTNEIRMEDQAGSEEIMIHAQKDCEITVANDKKVTVGNDETSNIKVNSTVDIHGNEEVKITKGFRTQVAANQTVHVGSTRTVEVNAVTGLNVAGNATSTIGGGQTSMVGSPLAALLSLAAEKAAEFAAAKAGEALAHINAAVQSKVDQAMGPVQSLLDHAQNIGAAMQSVGGGDLGAVGGVLASAGKIPSVDSVLGGLAASRPAGGGASSGEIGATNMLAGAAQKAIQRGVGAAEGALADALGVGGGDAGGTSMANTGGPEGNVDGVDETDRTKGPGHTLYKITGSHTEKVGSMKGLLALNGINTNVAGSKTETIGVAKLECVLKDYAESVEGSKNETTAGGLIVFTKGDETEHVGQAKTTMVGGAIIDEVKGGHSIEATAPATFVGAIHKIEAGQSIVFKCGPSEVTIDGNGVTIKSPLITMTAAKIQLPKAVTEV